MQTIKDEDFSFKAKQLDETFNELKRIRKCVTAALEIKRNEKIIGSSLQAKVTLFITAESKKILKEINLAEMCIVSQVELKDFSDKSIDAMNFEEDKISVSISLASGEKCERCWTVLPEVGSNSHNLCERCDSVWQSFQ